MKYLKSYNESIDNKLLELKEFCESNLAYLVDDGFEVVVSSKLSDFSKGTNLLYINIKKNSNTNFINGLFKWDDISDDFIPFYHILSSKCDILETYLLCDTSSGRLNQPKVVITSDDILEDKVNDKIDDIKFYFNKKIVNTTHIHNVIVKIDKDEIFKKI
jgi:hypothetical protein